jgi:hypothetical protein
MDNAEKKLGTWTLPKEEDKKALAQAQKKDDPICPSSGCPEPKVAASQKKSDPICPSSGCPEPKKDKDHPINYPVPDLGMDRDIKDSIKHMKTKKLIREP